MKVTFLGTGTSQGVPVIACTCEVCRSSDFRDKRLRSSLLIETCGKVFVIDSGPDFRQQMLREEVHHLDAILFTHEHKDHIAGLDDIRAYNYLTKLPMDIYAEARVLEALKREFAYAFAEQKYYGIPEMILHRIEEDADVLISGVRFKPVRAIHCQLPVLAYRIADVTYITDANHLPEEEKQKIKGTRVLIINALRKKKHISHFCLDDALSIIEEIKPQVAYITHISHQMGLHEIIQNELPANVYLAYDRLCLECEE